MTFKSPVFKSSGLKVHAAIDMALVAFGFAAPALFGFTDHLLPLAYALGLSGFGLLINLLTAYPAGLFPVLPLVWHRFIEWTSPVPFIVGPWLLFPDTPGAAWPLTAIGLAIVANTFLLQPMIEHPANRAKQPA